MRGIRSLLLRASHRIGVWLGRAFSRNRAGTVGITVASSPPPADDTKGRFDHLLPPESSKTIPLTETCRGLYRNKVVLISGAGGSIGSALAKQVMTCLPAQVVLLELNEFALYEVNRSLEPGAGKAGIVITPVLGSVADPRTVRRIFEKHQVHVVLHAAAYKHVPLVEANPMVGLVNNVFGTQTLAEQAAYAGVERFILLSSDKAVRPANVMGASKRLAEFVVLDLSRRDGQSTAFSLVRFGNVIGSSGSVVPLFQEQIARGGPVTVTHPKVERYFMTVQDATNMVLEAGARAHGGEVFLPDMGTPVRIDMLARRMIEGAGQQVDDQKRPNSGIEVVYTGLRPGEKLVEELSLSTQKIPTDHPRVFSAIERGLTEVQTATALRALKEAFLANNEQMAADVIAQWVEGPRAPPQQDAMRRTS